MLGNTNVKEWNELREVGFLRGHSRTFVSIRV